MFHKASNNRDWRNDFEQLASAKLESNKLFINNVRNNLYPEPPREYETVWEKRVFDISKLRKLWLVLEPFHPNISAIAHPFLSFEFDNDFLALSIEARTTKAVNYSILKGLLGNFEIIYSFGSERDFMTRRACYQNHQLYLYPLVATRIEVLTLLLTAVATANMLNQQARFYNSASNNCTTTLRHHANQVRPGSFPALMLANLLPGLSDKILYKKHWIDTNTSLADLRQVHSIRERVCFYQMDGDFSRAIRGIS